MNVEQRQAAVDSQTKPRDLGCEFACRQLSSTTIIAIYYYYSARKLILIYCPTEGRRLSTLITAQSRISPMISEPPSSSGGFQLRRQRAADMSVTDMDCGHVGTSVAIHNANKITHDIMRHDTEYRMGSCCVPYFKEASAGCSSFSFWGREHVGGNTTMSVTLSATPDLRLFSQLAPVPINQSIYYQLCTVRQTNVN